MEAKLLSRVKLVDIKINFFFVKIIVNGNLSFYHQNPVTFLSPLFNEK